MDIAMLQLEMTRSLQGLFFVHTPRKQSDQGTKAIGGLHSLVWLFVKEGGLIKKFGNRGVCLGYYF